MNPRLRKECKHSKNACPSKEMELIFLLKQWEMRNKHDGHCPQLPTCGPHFSLPGFKKHWLFPRRETPCSLWVHREIPHVTLWLRGAWRRAPGWGFLWQGQPWAGEFSPHPSTVVGLFRLGTISQAPQPAWTIGTFNNLYVGDSTDLSYITAFLPHKENI